MEYVNGLPVNFIIHHFEQITSLIKANSQIFVFFVFDGAVKPWMQKGVPYVYLAHAVFESGVIEHQGHKDIVAGF
jgi:hypothetical protein